MPDPAVTLLAFDSAVHLPLLAEWLARPHVQHWFGDPDGHLSFARDVPPGADHALIALGDHPIGYLRWQSVSRASLDAVGLEDIPAGSIDIDLFIGDLRQLHRGIGPQALGLLLQRLAADPTVPLAGLTSSVDNLPAHRAFEQAGFQRVRQYTPPGYGLCWLFTYVFPRGAP